MRIIYTQIVLLFFLSFLVGCSSSDNTIGQEGQQEEEISANDANDDIEEEVSEPLAALVMTDVSYGDNPEQVYDIYLPEGRLATKTKVMVIIHGGGFTSGDKANMQLFVSYLLNSHPDHAIVNINYVLAKPLGPAAFPNQYLDIDTIINQITEQQEDLQVLAEFGFLGRSAGAHLAMMYDYTYDTEDVVKFVVDIVGPTDFTDPFFNEDPNSDTLLTLLADATQFPNGTDIVAANSPALVVNNASSPTLLFYGNEDPIVPLTNGERLTNELNALNVTHEFTVYDGGHADNWSVSDNIDLLLKTSAYIDTYLAIEY